MHTPPNKDATTSALRELVALFDSSTLSSFWRNLFPNYAERRERLAAIGIYVLNILPETSEFEHDLAQIADLNDYKSDLLQHASHEDWNGGLVGPFVVLSLNKRSNPSLVLMGQTTALDIMLDNTARQLSPSEKRVTLQVLAGQALRDSADLDAVSYSTKRNQLKSAMGKLAISRQSDLQAKFLKGLLARLARLPAAPTSEDFLRHYCDQYLPKTGVRTHTIHDDLGRAHRVLDIGPMRGQRLLAAHPSVMPRLREADIDVLNSHDLRVFWPIRPGAFCAQDPNLTTQDHRDLSVAGLLATQQTFFEGPVPLFACVDGANYAIRFARENPDAVSHLIFGGYTGVLPGDALISGVLRRGAIRLSAKAPKLMRKAFQHYANNMKDIKKLKAAVQKSFIGSTVDHAIISREFDEYDHGQDFQTRVLGAIGTIRQDMIYQAENLSSELDSISVPKTFVHGALDLVQPIQQVEVLASNLSNAKLITLPKSGQLIYYEHFEDAVGVLKAEIAA